MLADQTRTERQVGLSSSQLDALPTYRLRSRESWRRREQRTESTCYP